MIDTTHLTELSDSEVKETEIALLLDFLTFCREENLTCFLAYGTLIGAARHNGFIPWDDDIDLMMPRPDYERLAALRDKLTERFPRISAVLPGDKRSRHALIKIIDEATVKIEGGIKIPSPPLGVDLDIFPLDAAPAETDEELLRIKRRLDRHYLLHFFKQMRLRGASLKRLIVITAAHFFPSARRQIAAAERILGVGKSDYASAKRVVSYGTLYNSAKNVYDRAWFDSTVDLPFEGHSVPAPIGYDSVLRAVFGDYMQLPPEEKRVTHHVNRCYRKPSAETEAERSTICKD